MSDSRRSVRSGSNHGSSRLALHLAACASAAVLGVTACMAATSLPVRSPAPCVSRGIGVDSECLVNGVALHYVDWGGRGGDMVLLAGLDDSARVYDQLAPLLAKHYRVLAVTRRGFGRSAMPTGGYDPVTLALDLRDFLKAVGVRRADLVGHSMSGLELTRVAASNPELVRRLVYLDAATDKSGLADAWGRGPLGNLDPPTAALASYARLTDWTQHLLKSRSPAIEANLRQCFASGSSGLVFRTPKKVDDAVLTALLADHPDYSAVRAPALAIYADFSRADQVPKGTSAQVRAAADYFSRTVIVPWQTVEKARFRQNIACGSVLELKHTGHYLFLERPRDTADWINSFLASENPCAWTPGAQSAGAK